jgi:CheY-like chemotaxis protein/anti-sigma regulatory factor (Ser/Thr protein kinase)
VLTNLLSNAVKFTPAGKVAVEVSASRPADREALLRVEVTDTGIGIETSDVAELFDPFHQADVSLTRKYGGTGIGLAVARRLVELLGGEIGVRSEPGRGSTFWFTARVGVREPADERAPMSGASERRSAPEAMPRRGEARARILVVEDNPVNAAVIVAMLHKLGYRTELATDGWEAVAAFSPGSFDAVLMDCQMPGLDGYAATSQIRLQEEGDRTPIIAVTAKAMRGDRDECLAAGMDDYLAKPLRAESLDEVLQRWVTGGPESSVAA